MYPLVQIGPFRLSSGGLVLLISLMIGSSLVSRVARARGAEKLARQADNCFYPVLIGAVIGARLWYGLFNLDLYGRNLGLFVALRVSDFAWPGALLSGMLAGYLWCRWNGFDEFKLADTAALTLPVVQAIGYIGLLLSGEAFGLPTRLPWGVSLFGATRHPNPTRQQERVGAQRFEQQQRKPLQSQVEYPQPPDRQRPPRQPPEHNQAKQRRQGQIDLGRVACGSE